MYYTKKPQASDIQLLADFKSGERGILYHSTIFCNSLIFKCRL